VRARTGRADRRATAPRNYTLRARKRAEYAKRAHARLRCFPVGEKEEKRKEKRKKELVALTEKP